MIIADTGALFAFYNSREPGHGQVKAFIDASRERQVVSPYVLAELDYLVATRAGTELELDVLRQFAIGAYELPPFDSDDIARAIRVIDKYRDQEIGLTDASIVVLADRYKTKEILTLDRRHFEVLRPLSGGRFKLLP